MLGRIFQSAMIAVLVGIVVMVVATIWDLSATSDYMSAESRYISAYDHYDSDAIVETLWDQYNAYNDMVLASSVFSFGFILVAFGVALIAFGLHERESSKPMQPQYYPSHSYVEHGHPQQGPPVTPGPFGPQERP